MAFPPGLQRAPEIERQRIVPNASCFDGSGRTKTYLRAVSSRFARRKYLIPHKLLETSELASGMRLERLHAWADRGTMGHLARGTRRQHPGSDSGGYRQKETPHSAGS